MHSSNVSYRAVTDANVSAVSVKAVISNGLISEEQRLIFQWILYAGLITVLSSFGIATNIINIICFVKQGLKDPVNVSLLGLALSDFGCLVTSLIIGVVLNPAFSKYDPPYDDFELAYLTAGWPHVVFTGVTSWLTAFITLERSLCITMPLKVKSIITPQRAKIIIASVFLIFTCAVSPVYYSTRFVIKFSPDQNRTILALEYTSERELIDQIAYALSNAIFPFSAYLTIIVCTVTLVVNLHKKAKWRLKCTAPVNADATSERDQKVSRMVVMVSTLFIICFSPLCITLVTTIFVPGLAVDGQYKNTTYILGGVCLLLETTNSSSNIFIYYRMSSRYKATFRQLFGLDKL